MATQKIMSRKEALCENKELLARNASIMVGCDEENIRIIKSKISEAEAKAKLEEFWNDPRLTFNRNVPSKLAKAVKNANAPIVRKEYFPVLANYFNVTEIEYSYCYTLNDDAIKINPQRYEVNMDVSVFVESIAGRYMETAVGKKTFMGNWENLLESECIPEFEDGFVAHKFSAEDEPHIKKKTIDKYWSKVEGIISNMVQKELGAARKLAWVNLIDQVSTRDYYTFAAPFYVFQYDLGKQVLTVTVDAYSGEISTPIINDPFVRALYETEEKLPNFNIIFFIIAMCFVPVIGGALYGLNYLQKKSKVLKTAPLKAPKYNINELKNLM